MLPAFIAVLLKYLTVFANACVFVGHGCGCLFVVVVCLLWSKRVGRDPLVI